MLQKIKQRRERKLLAGKLCAEISAAAREPALFRDYGVPDTFDGRFDMLALHAWLALERLDTNDVLARDLVEALFARLEEALREQGAGDVGIGRRMKAMASAFYGRLNAYRSATNEAALAEAVLRNIYRGAPEKVEQAARLAKYAEAARPAVSPGEVEP